MSTVNKEDYYTNNSSINIHIDNIISFRDFLNAVLSDIKSGEYNIHMIKNLSQTVEKFYNDIDDNGDIFKPNNDNSLESKQLTPKTVETYQYSDSDSDDTESIITVVSGMSESDSENPKSPSKSAYSITKFFSHKPYDVSNNDPDFLDDYYGPTTPQNTSLNSRTQEQKVVQYDYYQSLYEQHKQEVTEQKTESTSITFEKSNSGTFSPHEPKHVDKLALAFLNNNLELNNYHYLKNFNQNHIDNFCASSYIY
jgi:hypothetical protein